MTTVTVRRCIENSLDSISPLVSQPSHILLRCKNEIVKIMFNWNLSIIIFYACDFRNVKGNNENAASFEQFFKTKYVF